MLHIHKCRATAEERAYLALTRARAQEGLNLQILLNVQYQLSTWSRSEILGTYIMMAKFVCKYVVLLFVWAKPGRFG